jgi:chemotaxis protein MotB
MKRGIIILLTATILVSCEAKKELRQSRINIAALRQDSLMLANRIADLQGNISVLNAKMADLNKQIASLSNQTGQLGQQNVNQQNQLSQANRTVQEQQARLLHLQNLLAQQRAASDSLKAKMSQALGAFGAKELTITQKNGKVYVSLSENLLFPSGSAVVNPRGVEALSKLAAVLNVNPDVAVMIEGHTDTVPIHGKYRDNWQLSTERANAIVRILVNNYKVDPKRVEASGHSQYDPVDNNTTSEGRAMNRRTEIILTPKLEELYKILGSE